MIKNPSHCEQHAVHWNIALWTWLRSRWLKISSSVSGVSCILSLIGDRGSDFLQEGSFSYSLHKKTKDKTKQKNDIIFCVSNHRPVRIYRLKQSKTPHLTTHSTYE